MIDYKKDLFSHAYKHRVPLTATIELISECNFRCVHCYIDNTVRKDILSYDQVVDFGEQIIKMGCLYVILTGGEVLLHPDFKRIYTYFATKGVCVSVFTNGSLIDNDVLSLFQNYPPRVVEITMYGFSNNTYMQVAKTPKYDVVKNNIILLAQNGINVLLKMFVLNNNYCDFESIRQFALEYSIPFKYDTRIICESNSKEMMYQIDDELSLKLELSKSSTAVKYNEETFNYIVGTRQNKLFQCGAGRSSCWLKSNYHLRLCNFLSCVEYDLNKYNVAEAWKLMEQYINDDIPRDSKCYDCIYRKYCNYCPATSFVGFKRTDMLFQNTIFCKNARLKASKDKESE